MTANVENIQLLVFFDSESINNYIISLGADLVSITNLSNNVNLSCANSKLNFQEGSTVVASPNEIKFDINTDSHIYLSVLPIFNKNNKTDCLM